MAAPITLDALITSVRSTAPHEPLAQLEEAARLKDEVGELTDALLGHFVDQARRGGASWSQIGEALGVSKQAAQQKHTGRTVPNERYTERSRQAIERAADAARRLGHGYVGTEHLLLGLLAVEGGLAAVAMAERGITVDAVKAHVTAVLSAGGDQVPGPVEPGLPVPHTPRAARVLVGALYVALEMGHNYIGTEHLLLSLYREPEGLAAQFLLVHGVTEEALRQRLVQMLGEIVAAQQGGSAG
jgi:hypothetical protein